MLMVLAASCDQRQPAISDAEFREFRDAWPGMTKACLEKVRYGGFLSVAWDQPECFEMQPARQWRGLLQRGFEWSNFCPAPARRCPISADAEDIWLEFAKGARDGPTLEDGLYALEFFGRRTKVPGPFGHLNQYDHLIVVDRLISVRRVADE
jgi:hypothetical protein